MWRAGVLLRLSVAAVAGQVHNAKQFYAGLLLRHPMLAPGDLDCLPCQRMLLPAAWLRVFQPLRGQARDIKICSMSSVCQQSEDGAYASVLSAPNMEKTLSDQVCALGQCKTLSHTFSLSPSTILTSSLFKEAILDPLCENFVNMSVGSIPFPPVTRTLLCNYDGAVAEAIENDHSTAEQLVWSTVHPVSGRLYIHDVPFAVNEIWLHGPHRFEQIDLRTFVGATYRSLSVPNLQQWQS